MDRIATPTLDDRRLRAAGWLLAATIVATVLALGSLYTEVLAAAVGMLAVAAWLAWHRAERYRLRPAAAVLLVTGVALTAWTLVQAVPLPAGLVSVIAPANADVWARALSPLREPGPGWVTLSLDPIATRVQVLRGVGYLLAFVVTLRVAHAKEGAIFLERVLVGAAVAMAMAALLHPAFGATRVFGVYEPVSKYAFAPNHISPLLNQNHLVAYLNLGTCVGLGAIISSRPSMNRILGGACVVLLFVVGRWAGSRGGTLAIFAGVVGAVLMTRSGRGLEKGKRTLIYVAIVVALLGLGLLVVASSSDAYTDLSSTDLSKGMLAKEALSMAPTYPIFGIGRGAFESVFPAFRMGTGYWVFTHPENVIPQWIVEWGIPVGVAGLAVVAWSLRPSVALERSRPPAGAWAALACLAVHNLVDFNSEVPGVMMALTVCAGLVVAGSAGVRGGSARERALPGSRVAFAAPAVAAGAIAMALPGIPHELNTDQARLYARLAEPDVPAAAVRAELSAAMLRHPADPYFPFVGAALASRARDQSPIPWIGRALERSVVFGRAHLLLARDLVTRSPSQARLEYRLALEQDRNIVPLAELPRLVGSYDDAMELVPAGEAGDAVIESLATSLRDRLPSTSVRLDQLAISRGRPGAASERQAERALADLAAEDAAPWCDVQRARCVDRALDAAKAVVAAEPSLCKGHALRAQILARYGDEARALRELDGAAAQVTDRDVCYEALLDLALAAHDEARATGTIDRLSRAGCSSDAECAATLVHLAQVEESRGNGHRAVGFLKKAAERAPERDDILTSAGRLEASLGMHADAAAAYGELARRHPDVADWRDRAASERAAATTVHLPRR